ncbi:MAG: phosphomethylpyrimidine kinase, partial [Caulobacteraceae bacterium]
KLLSIAGSDPSGGAGVQADLKTFSAFGCYGMAAITALTAQNTQGVTASYPIAPEIVAAQIEAVLSDITPDAIKIGMLATPDIARAVAETLARYKAPNIVLDPVLVPTQGLSSRKRRSPRAPMKWRRRDGFSVTPAPAPCWSRAAISRVNLSTFFSRQERGASSAGGAFRRATRMGPVAPCPRPLPANSPKARR